MSTEPKAQTVGWHALLGWCRQVWRRTRCEHEWAWVRNVYGDEINHADGKRSVWICPKCRDWRYRNEKR